jgi:hypothetical protein
MMSLLTLIGGPIGKLVRRVMLALVPPARRTNPNDPSEALKYPMF